MQVSSALIPPQDSGASRPCAEKAAAPTAVVSMSEPPALSARAVGHIVSSHHEESARKGVQSQHTDPSQDTAHEPADHAADAAALVAVSKPPGSESRQHDIGGDEAGGSFHEEGSYRDTEADEELALLEAAFEVDEVGHVLSPACCHAMSGCSR